MTLSAIQDGVPHLVDHLCRAYSGRSTRHVVLPAQLGVQADFPAGLPLHLQTALRHQGVQQLCYCRQQGDEDAAFTYFQRHHKRLGEQGLLDLAWMYRRRQNWELAVSIWEHLAQRQCAEAIERLAKYHEHVRRDHQSALELTSQLKTLYC